MYGSVRSIGRMVITALGVCCSTALAQPSVALRQPDAKFADPFTRVTSIREIAPNRVLVSDMMDKIVMLVDLQAGSATKIGREGQGPGEYALPATLFALPGGQTWLQDVLGRRFLPIDFDGKVGAPVRMPGATGPGLFIGLNGGGSDAQGRLYFEVPLINPAGAGGRPETPESLAIHRWDRSSTKLDTVAWLGNPKDNIETQQSGGRARVTIGAGKVFAPAEAWGVAGDGAVARVIPSPYRVVWYVNGRATAGAVVPYQPIKVTDADKREVIEQRKKAKPMMIAMGPGGQRAAPPPNVQLPEPEFAETKPPFTGPGSVLVTPSGEVWVLRTRSAGDETPVYDVFGRSGAIVRRVTLNPRSKVIGFGERSVYVVRSDEDDLQYLERYRQ